LWPVFPPRRRRDQATCIACACTAAFQATQLVVFLLQFCERLREAAAPLSSVGMAKLCHNVRTLRCSTLDARRSGCPRYRLTAILVGRQEDPLSVEPISSLR
jgi:hypothetical protein